jgi:hypothetical protein
MLEAEGSEAAVSLFEVSVPILPNDCRCHRDDAQPCQACARVLDATPCTYVRMNMERLRYSPLSGCQLCLLALEAVNAGGVVEHDSDDLGVYLIVTWFVTSSRIEIQIFGSSHLMTTLETLRSRGALIDPPP